jgi:biotin carboxylase
MDKIAIIGSGIMAKVVADRARELGIESHCFSFDNSDIACSAVDAFHEVDIFDTDEIIHICEENQIAGVIATTELTILPAAKVASVLGLNGNPVKAAEKITNKYFTREQVKRVKELKQPRFWKYVEGDLPQIDKFPVIVKPIAAGGKRGICVVWSQSELLKAVEGALPFSRAKGVLIEEYLEGGTEYSVESLSYNGQNYIVQITQKDTSGPPHCNELGHHQPAPLSEERRRKVESVISEMLTAVGIENGPCHTEIKIIEGKIYLIEINARPGGDHITHPLTELSTGYPFVSGIIWIALNQFTGHEPINLEKNYAGIYFVTEETADLRTLFDECQKFPWVYAKHQVSEEPSKIMFNDEEGLNYFIYFDKKEKPDIKALMKELEVK